MHADGQRQVPQLAPFFCECLYLEKCCARQRRRGNAVFQQRKKYFYACMECAHGILQTNCKTQGNLKGIRDVQSCCSHVGQMGGAHPALPALCGTVRRLTHIQAPSINGPFFCHCSTFSAIILATFGFTFGLILPFLPIFRPFWDHF